MRFGVLGAVQVRAAGGEPVPVGGRRARSLLALLLLDAGRIVTADRLIDGLYGDDPPGDAANALQSQVSRLRRRLRDAGGSDGVVEFHPAGYRLAVDPGDVDVHRFERLAAAGRRALAAGEHARAAALLGDALGLWRGPALADVSGAPFAARQAARLEESRIAAVEDRAEAQLALGRHRDVVPVLRETVAAHPLRERLRGQLMRALYGSGRQGEALAVFDDARRTLAEQLGADPSPELAAVHLAVLRADPSLAPPASTAGVPRAPAGTGTSPAGSRPGRSPGDPGVAGGTPHADALQAAGPAETAFPLHDASPQDAPPATGAGTGSPAAKPEPEPAGADRPGASGESSGSRATVRRGLAAQLTSFVGRAEELARIEKLLTAERLVTLVGPGGTGKTRLAVEAGGRARGDVCFVDLAQIEGAAGDRTGPSGAVAQAVIDALGLRETGLLAATHATPHDSVRRLVDALTDRPMLLILDNCEHVIDDAARLAGHLLGACPALRVLATSREVLGITGETLCPVPPLAAPPPGTEPPDAVAYPAVRLFADRAAAVRPDLVVDAATLPGVLRICTALDGLPLAIELAAARLRSLSVAEVAARLGAAGGAEPRGDRSDDRFRLLARGDRTKAARHRTLRAVVQWSWDLLSDDEQVLARRMTVFAGGATPDAVARVCGLADAEDLLADLADKSLVENTGGRYRMLETVRAFCAERLAEAGETERLRAAHAACFLDLIEAAEPYLRRAEQLDRLARLNAEHANLLSALRWAVHADQRLALRMLASMASYWWLRGLRSEGAALARDLLNRVAAETTEEYALCVMLAVYGGTDDPSLRAHAAQVDSIMRALPADRPPLRPISTLLWAISAGPSQDNREVQQRRMGWDPWSRALLHFGLAYAQLFDGDVDGAERDLALGEELFRGIGDRWGLSAMLAERARIAGWRGEWERARTLTGEAHALVRMLDSAEDIADTLCLRAETLIRMGDLAGAGTRYERALELARQAGAPEKVADVQRGMAELARFRGDLPAARRLHEAALRRCTAESFVVYETRALGLVGRGRLAAAEGDAAAARADLRRALELGLGQGDVRIPAFVAEALADAAVLAGDGARAAVLLGAGVALRGLAIAGDRDVARTAEAARGLIGAATFDAAYERGAALPRADALALLRSPPAGTGDA